MKEKLKIKWIDLFTTTRCNLKCNYCFHQIGNEDMSPEDAISYIDSLAPFLADDLIVNFFGGEPLLNTATIKAVVENYKKYRFGICTNGTIFDEELFKFFVEKNVKIQVSIDGDEETHNKNRGNHSLTVGNIKKMLDIGINLTARLTYTPDNVSKLYDNIVYIHSLGINSIMHQGVQEASWDEKSLNTFKEQTDKLFKLVKDKPELKITYINRSLKYCSGSGLICQAGKEMIALLPGGEIYPCHKFASNKIFKLGNVSTGFSRGLFTDITRDSLILCRSCKAKPICHTCIATNYEVNGSLLEPVVPFCDIIKYEYSLGEKMRETKGEGIEERLRSIEEILSKLAVVVIDISELLASKNGELPEKE